MAYSNSELNHRSGLVRRELVLISLIGIQDAEFHGEESLTGGLNEWKIPKLKADTVLLNEVVVD